MGFNTTVWGPGLWTGNFLMALNYTSHPAPNKKDIYLNYFGLLGDMLPCKYCREYYTIIKRELPLSEFLDDETLDDPVMVWLYLVKDMVNKKLIRQESECFAAQCDLIDTDPNLSSYAKARRKTALRKKIFYTKPSPPYEEVVAYYEQFRSGCSSDANVALQSCRHIP